ncbi:hypothetical protein N7466_008540 [Penicillium verhagenii]|uniref:uncharacterized protein n=1 Tax=Penicillium verhagenii TaxID=1562060 RepID=UPI0025458BAE|nr:uncharacterized protein N7466_008540 [Penicillium verhagenii]KAJ5924353.1 hypothetical protein N7466_008540 [Penicillium verhagenii]
MSQPSKHITVGIMSPPLKKPAAIAADVIVSLTPEDKNESAAKTEPGLNAEKKASGSNKARRSRRGRARGNRGHGGGNKIKLPVSSEARPPVVANRPCASASAADPSPHAEASAPPGDKGVNRRAPFPSANSCAGRPENVDFTPASPLLPTAQPVAANESSEGWLIEFSDSE